MGDDEDQQTRGFTCRRAVAVPVLREAGPGAAGLGSGVGLALPAVRDVPLRLLRRGLSGGRTSMSPA
jgi:hypothetical protein